MTTLYLIRHGTTDSNLAGVFQGKLDTSLNERGMEQARLLAQRFAGVPFRPGLCVGPAAGAPDRPTAVRSDRGPLYHSACTQ